MEITYDPTKNALNIEQRGLNFNDVIFLDWDKALIARDTRQDYGEDRYVAIVPLKNRLYIVCYTKRDNTRRIISFRKANIREVKCYEKRLFNK